MTVLPAGVDQGIGTRAMMRPAADEGIVFAHLLLLPGLDAALCRQEECRAGLGPWLDRLRLDTGYREPESCVAACGGSERRAAAHLLAMHAAAAVAGQFRGKWSAPAFRALQRRCLFLLDLAARQPEPESEEASR